MKIKKNLHCILITHLLCVIAGSQKYKSDIKYPLIFVPGIKESILEAKLNNALVEQKKCIKNTNNYFILWINTQFYKTNSTICMDEYLTLLYNNKTRTTSNTPGVNIEVPEFGKRPRAIEFQSSDVTVEDDLNDITEMLVKLGYRIGYSLRGAPYDFRKGPNEHTTYFNKLKLLIEETYTTNGNKSVIMLVRSMGALMSGTFLRRQTQEWKDKYIKSLVSISGDWGGAVGRLITYTDGVQFGKYTLRSFSTFPSISWILPHPFIWNPYEVFVETPSKNYSLSNLKDYFVDINYEVGWELYQDIYPDVEKDPIPLGVELHCIYGYGIPTIRKIYYGKGAFPNKPPVLIKGDGDGTVNKQSLSACAYWIKLQTQPIHLVPMKGSNHTFISRTNSTLEYIKNLVT
ncbi:hypothetical protein PGB90_007120 [Kerria lacca]